MHFMKDRDYMILDIKPGNILYKYVDGMDSMLGESLNG